MQHTQGAAPTITLGVLLSLVLQLACPRARAWPLAVPDEAANGLGAIKLAALASWWRVCVDGS
jgi:hypothetical protein